jgi:nifR3 family TIM-barrel protein
MDKEPYFAQIPRTAHGFFTALAPMANVTNPPSRALAIAYQCGYTVTEMVSAHHLVHGGVQGLNALRLEKIQGNAQSTPHVVQLLGSDPDLMAEASRIVAEQGADAIDINMGCPIRRIAHGCDAGVALMREPKKAALVLSAVRRASALPVSAKLRAGWDEQSVNAVEVSMALQDAGACGLVLHARTREQVYSGDPRMAVISAVKAAVQIPVVGNGGVQTVQDAVAMHAQTGCDGVMIGRGALGNPWLFTELHTGVALSPSLTERLTAAREYTAWYVQFAGENAAARQVRKHLCWFVKGTSVEAELRVALPTFTSTAAIFETLLQLDYRAKQFARV